MKTLINMVNLPRNISRYSKKRLIENNTGDTIKKEEFFNILYFLAGVIFLISNYLLRSHKYLYLSIGGMALLTIITYFINRGALSKIDTVNSSITKIILKDENGKTVKLWEIKNQNSLLIGKKTSNNEVDIDLSMSIYSSLISREHAIMNFSGNKWYFEDIGSSNGSGLKRKREDKKIKVEEGKSYRVYSGDTIYIANTMLFLK